MVVRRVVYRLLFPMAFLLPLWVLIGRGIVLDGIGWEFLVYLIVCPLLFIGLLVIGALVVWRPGIRKDAAVSWWDVAVLGSLWLTLLVAGFVAHPAVVALAVVLLIAVFWVLVWQLVAESRRRVQAVMDDIDATTRGARASVQQPQPVDIGEVIVVTSRDVTPPVGASPQPPRGDAPQ